MTAMLYLIIIGAHVFGPFLALTHIPETLALQMQSIRAWSLRNTCADFDWLHHPGHVL